MATQDGRFVTLYLECDWKLSKLRDMIKENFNVPLRNQKLLLDGKELRNDDLTMEQNNVKNGDVIYCVYVPDQEAAVPQGYPYSGKDEALYQRARTMMDSMPPGSHELAALRQTAPDIYAAIESGDIEKLVIALRAERVMEMQKLRDQQIRILQAQLNPLDPGSQRVIHEAIVQNRIDENLANAQNYLPESFGNIVMLYIKVNINAVPLQALVDTGAQTTVMSKECAEKCNLMVMVDKRFRGIAVGVSTGKIIGKIHLANMKIGNTYIPFSVFILDSIDIDFILGLDLLRRHQCTINLKENMLHICGEDLTFLAEREIEKPLRLSGITQGASQSRPAPVHSVVRNASPAVSRSVSQAHTSVPAPVSNEVKTLSGALGISHEAARALLDSTNGDIELAASLHYQQQYD